MQLYVTAWAYAVGSNHEMTPSLPSWQLGGSNVRINTNNPGLRTVWTNTDILTPVLLCSLSVRARVANRD
ncbi:hypothetical protein AB1N83_003474 [Pleurotus pulmonarius]